MTLRRRSAAPTTLDKPPRKRNLPGISNSDLPRVMRTIPVMRGLLRDAARLAVVASLAVLASGVAAPDAARAGDTMNAEQARAFVVGRLFSFSCFEGTRGAGRISADGSVAGTIALREKPIRYVRLPPNTVRVRGDNVCGFMRGMAFEPCFDVMKTGPASFRGTLAGVQTMWCDFVGIGGGEERPRMASRRKGRPAAEASAD